MLIDDVIKGGRKHAHIHLPESSGFQSAKAAFRSSTRAVFGAHADDEAIMAAKLLNVTRGSSDEHMTAIIGSASPGTNRAPQYKGFDDEKMIGIRWQEQMKAADIGQYALTAQLGFKSAQIQGMETGNPWAAQEVKNTIKEILKSMPNLKELYLHNWYDEHPTHRHFLLLTLDAIREMPNDWTAPLCLGVEVSSDLSWLPIKYKTELDISSPRWTTEILEAYVSEDSKKGYAQAILGRMLSHASFRREMPDKKKGKHILCAIDYSPIINAPKEMPVEQALDQHISDVMAAFHRQKRRAETLEAYAASRDLLARMPNGPSREEVGADQAIAPNIQAPAI